MTKVIFLTGAPQADSLDWTDDDALAQDFNSSTQRFLGNESAQNTSSPDLSELPKWRLVKVLERYRPDAAPPQHAPADPRFYSSSSTSANDAARVSFLEHSMAILENLDSSQIEPPVDTAIGETNVVISKSFNTTFSTDPSSPTTSTDSLLTNASDHSAGHTVTFLGPITDLKQIPNARHILSIQPQTMTVNILAGVIAIRPPRTVRTRRNNVDMDIVELILGDDTRAGFSISFWLPPLCLAKPSHHPPSQDPLRQHLASLRAGAVLLITHIALSAFQGAVYGQSLSKRITRTTTAVVPLSPHVAGLNALQLAKFHRVRRWAADFVGVKRAPSPVLLRGSGVKRRKPLELPPDTQ